MNKHSPFIREKKEVIDAYRRVQPEMTAQLADWYKLEFVYTANLLEGSTLSRIETSQVITKGITIGGKTLKEQNDAVLDALAVDWIRRSAKLTRNDIDEQMVISLHHLPSIKENVEGFLKYTYQVPYVLTEYTEWLHVQRGNDVEVAVSAFIKLLEMKPFQDRNSKTALLLLNLVLLMEGYPLTIIPEEKLEKYVRAVSQISLGQPTSLMYEVLAESIDSSLSVYLQSIEQKPSNSHNKLLKIGQLAQITNESIPTIRHWTKQGLLQVASFTAGGYQLYDTAMAEVVVQIRQLQREQRMKVTEIKEILGKQRLVLD